jgi:MFS family permease
VLEKENGTPPAPAEKTGLARILADMQVGIGFIFHHAGILFVMLAMASGMFVIGCFGPLIAVYVRDSLHASTRTYGVASAMIGVGMFVGVNALTTLGRKSKNVVLVYSGLGGIALGVCLLTGLTHISSTIAATLIIGFAVAGIIVPATTMMQQETPPALMGRVGSTFMSLIFTAQISGLIVSGLIADYLGVRHVFAYCAVLLVLLIAAGRLWMEPRPAPTSAA